MDEFLFWLPWVLSAVFLASSIWFWASASVRWTLLEEKQKELRNTYRRVQAYQKRLSVIKDFSDYDI